MAVRIFAAVLLTGVLFAGARAMLAAPVANQQTAPVVTFNKDVLPLFQKHCQSCHRPGQIGPMSLVGYRDARPWARAIKEAVVLGEMPPWFADPHYGHFNNDRSLAQSEIDTIVAWVDGGAVEGDAKDAPPPIEWPEGGWQIEPDVTVEMPPYPVPATGVLEWESLAVPAPFEEDTWVTSVEIMPGEPSVTHHICFHFEKHRPEVPYGVYEWTEVPRDENGVMLRDRPSGAETTVVSRAVGSTVENRRKGRPAVSAGNQFCYLPGLQYEDYRPVDAGYFVPAGSDIIIGFHYNTNGRAVTDRTKIGFTVSKTPPAKRFLPQNGDRETGEASPVRRESGIRSLEIPPNESHYVAPLSEITFLKDVEIVWFRPHAHARGKSVQYKLIYPDGREEIVLNVPNYDFNWQLTYRTLVKVPKGSRMEVQFTYDNSAGNRQNPDPNTWVRYGDQSWEEMGSPNMGFLVDN